MKQVIVGSVMLGTLFVTGLASAAEGEAIYKQYCFACHDFGAAGAPKLDNKPAWVPRIAQGREALLGSVLNGKGAMPPRGTCGPCKDEELKAAVEYMVNRTE